MRTNTETLARALEILAVQFQDIDDGIPSAALREAAERLRQQHSALQNTVPALSAGCACPETASSALQRVQEALQ